MRNIKNSSLNRFFGRQYPFVFVLEGNGKMSKNGVKCAVFKISEVQNIF